ncbi:hypothetical protein STSP2_00520 [Anaerohalosphaera lusitana]|uniref:Uncharacterized protein n=1 Tax=Anaerohalosphaera lusitana TaxID=1936003 RepID=A0A1U9NIP3_9BACT|nr:hypothetical protein [Anaerohalosphaera lusitana]AQT67376.1 hypothetical protein STSP2_00520 [Anaerohalosphaera lusitana]
MLTQLLETLQNLAAPADKQIEYLDGMQVQELVWEFMDASDNLDILVEDGLLTTETYQAIKLLKAKVARLNNSQNQCSHEALKTSPDWQQVRQLAKQILNRLDDTL